MTSRDDAREVLRRIGSQPDSEIDVAEAALAFGALDEPGVALDPYRSHLAELVRDLADRITPEEDGLDARVRWLNDVIITRHGYQGDTVSYDDLRNANMLRVIDRRRGLPVALGILYLHAARTLGWDMVGLNFPGHFLVRLDVDGARAILDPFNEGQVRSVVDLRELLKATAGLAAELEPAHYQPVGNRDILLRLQNNMKLRYLSAHDVPGALKVLEGMRLIAPDEPTLWRETGLLHAHQGNVPEAISALEVFLHHAGTPRHRQQAVALIQQLKNRLH